MNLTAMVGFALVSAVLALLLRQHRPELATLLVLAAGAGMFLAAAAALAPAVRFLRELGDEAKFPDETVNILLKSLGICCLTQLASDVCRDAGESALAGKVEFAGRAAMVLVALPLFRQLLAVIRTLIFGET